MAGINRRKHILGLTGRGQLAGRFTRNIDYDSDDWGDGLTRINFSDYWEDKGPFDDLDILEPPPPGYGWKIETFYIYSVTWAFTGYDESNCFPTIGGWYSEGASRGYIMPAAAYEAADPKPPGDWDVRDDGWAYKLTLSGSTVMEANSVWHQNVKQHEFRIDKDGNMAPLSKYWHIDLRCGSLFTSSAAAYSFYENASPSAP